MAEGIQSGFRFRDRIDAGRVLADRLGVYRGKDVLALGIPRGGVPELDVIVARKLGAPGQPELAIGAVTANGGEFINEEMVGYLGVPILTCRTSGENRWPRPAGAKRGSAGIGPRNESRIVWSSWWTTASPPEPR